MGSQLSKYWNDFVVLALLIGFGLALAGVGDQRGP